MSFNTSLFKKKQTGTTDHEFYEIAKKYGVEFFYKGKDYRSNFYLRDQHEYDSSGNIVATYFCNEQYFMYSKAVEFKDSNSEQKILKAPNPSMCKRYGRQVKNFDVKIWKKESIKHMEKGLRIKFTDPQNKDLLDKLLSTYPKALAEASPTDLVWGIGLDKKDAIKIDPINWKGENCLGKLLMKIRNEIRNELGNNE